MTYRVDKAVINGFTAAGKPKPCWQPCRAYPTLGAALPAMHAHRCARIVRSDGLWVACHARLANWRLVSFEGEAT